MAAPPIRDILLTGATGNIGSALVRRLAEKRVRHRALVRNRARAGHLEGPFTAIIEGDFNDPVSLREAVDGCRTLFLLSPASPDQVTHQTTMVDAAAHANVKHIVKVSALGTADSSPINVAQWHAKIEREIRHSGITYTFLHPHSFMQNLLAQASNIRTEGKLYGAWGDARAALIDARDVADAAAEILTTPGHEDTSYVLTGPEAISYQDIALALAEAAGHKISYIDLQPEQLEASMINQGFSNWLAHDLALLAKSFREGRGTEVSPRMKQLTGSSGRRISDFATDYADLFRSATTVTT